MSRRGEKRRRADCKSATEQNGQRRRSPRLTSSNGEDDNHGPGSRLCTTSDQAIERKSQRPPCEQGDEAHPRHHEEKINKDKPSASQFKDSQKHEILHDESWLPEKRILELVLDTLQRRDTHDIFAEPVDPSEVEEYYEIITEPMDFGTMRAKLHEGLYKTLQQFEHDMYLIFDNAMYFNSSGTVYFRQARALEDLAKKVFHALKTDPENFELEFSATRLRRSSRKLDGEPKGLTLASGQKLAKDFGSNSMSTDIDQKGCKRRKRPHMTDIDRRCTYKPWKSMDDEIDSPNSPMNCDTDPLIHVNQDYRKSLMLFVKGLGPTARRVAERKLQGLLMQTPTNQNTSNSDYTANNNTQTPTAPSRLQTDLNESPYHSIPSTSTMSRHFTDTMNPHSIQEKGDVSKIREARDKGKEVKTFSPISSKDANTSVKLRKPDPDPRDQGNINNKNKKIVIGLQASRDRIHQNTSVSQRGAAGKGKELTAVSKDDHLLTYQRKAVPPSAKESKHSHAGMFDLNQVQAQATSSSSHPNSHFRNDSLRPTPFGLLSASNLSCDFNPAQASAEAVYMHSQNLPPLPPNRQFMFNNVPFLDPRLSGVTGFGYPPIVGHPRLPTPLQLGSEISWPSSSRMSFGQASTSQAYTHQNDQYHDNSHAPSSLQKNQPLTFGL